MDAKKPRQLSIAIERGKGEGFAKRSLVRSSAMAVTLLGREAELSKVSELLQEQRFVTIVGPGGMGKTTLARAVALQCAELYPDGVHVVDLAVLAEGRDLVGALGWALGIERLTRESLGKMAPSLRGQRKLIVLDCCEWHTAEAAHAAEAVLRAAPGIDVLCTSREPLLAHGERIVRLGPLAVPGPAEPSNAALALRFPAVALFVARTHGEDVAGIGVDDADIALVCEICRAVEGVPLALELAAALVHRLGLRQLACQTSRLLLDAGPNPEQRGDRHRSLASMLDWSYDTLAPEEQRVLRCLAVFRGSFTLDAAAAIAAGEGGEHTDILDILIELANKSLVNMGAEGGRMPRLLDLTREYAYDKLLREGELDDLQHRHALWLGTLMDELDRDWMTLSRSDWIDRYSPWIDDLLAAIDWGLGPGGDVLLAARLAGVGFSIGDQIGYSREFQERVQTALQIVGKLADQPPAIVMRLLSSVGDGRDPSGHPIIRFNAEFAHCLESANRAKIPLLQGAPLVSRWGAPYVRGDYPAALEGAAHMAEAARESADPYLELIAQRTKAQSLHFLGRHREAWHFARLTLANSHRRIPLPYLSSPMDVGVSIRITIARMLWMDGAPDQAVAVSEEALDLSENDRKVSMCHVLAMASVPLALWRGETAHAAQLVRRLRDRAERHGMAYWAGWAQAFEDGLDVIEGRAEAHDRPFFTDTHAFSAKCRDHLATFSPLMLTDDAVARVDAGMVGWCAPELLRVQALRCLSRDPDDSCGRATELLRRSLTMAEEQGAFAWALRSATSLAALDMHRGARSQAHATLEPVVARFREGEGTADVRTARDLMASLRWPA